MSEYPKMLTVMVDGRHRPLVYRAKHVKQGELVILKNADEEVAFEASDAEPALGHFESWQTNHAPPVGMRGEVALKHVR